MQNKNHKIILILSIIMLKINIHLSLAIENKNLGEALNAIVQQTLKVKSRQLLVFANFNNNSNAYRYGANDIIDRMLNGISNTTYTVLYHKQKLFVNSKHIDVVLLDNVETFRYFYGKLKDYGSMDLSRTILYISSLTTVDFDLIYRLFKDLYYMEIIRVALVICLSNSEIVMITYTPFTQTSCRDFKPIITNQYLIDQHRWAHNKYFPNKLNDFYGCPVYCCTWEDMPYFSVKRNHMNSSIIDYDGLEGELLEYLASTLKFSIKVHWINPIYTEVSNKDQFFFKVFSQHCDFSLGAYAYRNDLDYTSAFSQTNHYLFSHIYIITNIINSYTTYDKLAYPFHYTVWYALGLTFTLSCLLICICERKRQWSVYRNFLISSANRTPYFHLFAVAVGGSMTTINMPKRNFARFLLTCWLFLTLILRAAYQSGMYQMLHDNKQWNPAKTIEDVYERNYLISTTLENSKYLAILPNTQRVHIFNTTVLQAFEKLLLAKEPIAFIVPFEYYGFFGKTNFSQWDNLHIVQERLLTQQLTIYVRRNSYFVSLLNEKLSNAHYYGFISTWKRKNILSQATVFKHKSAAHHRNHKNMKKYFLSMNELGAIFMIVVWLHVFAFAVFLIELIWHCYENM